MHMFHDTLVSFAERRVISMSKLDELMERFCTNVYASLPPAPIAAESGLIYENKASETNVDTDDKEAK